MTSATTVEQGPIPVAVRNVQGIKWQEHWTKAKLAYFILMADVDPPKFDRVLTMEWVPFDSNEYAWDHRVLTRDEFFALSTAWPKTEVRPFDLDSCDHIRFVIRDYGKL